MNMKRLMTLIISLMAFIAVNASDASGREQALKAAAKKPMLHEGRIKPLDTFAQVNLLAIYGKRSIKKMEAIDWLLEAMFLPEASNERAVFDIRNNDVVNALNLETREGHKYSFTEVWPALRKNMDFLRSAFNKPSEERDLVEKQMLELYGNVSRFIEIAESLTFLQPRFYLSNEVLASRFGLQAEEKASFYYFSKKSDVFAAYLGEMQAKSEEELDANDLEIVKLAQALDAERRRVTTEILKIIPPEGAAKDQLWGYPWELLRKPSRTAQEDAFLDAWAAIYQSYVHNEPLDEALLDQTFAIYFSPDSELEKAHIDLEVWNNHANLFYKSLAFYILSFILLIISWAAWGTWMKRLSLGSMIVGTFLHAFGILLRMMIMGRPPVSTLYESIIFVGFISVFCAIIYEIVKKNSLGIFTGVVLGSILHFIGFSYAADGDTMGMLVAVLDSNFWLATHVVTISIGYGCAFVAGLIGHLYLFFKIFKPEGKERLLTLSKNMVGSSLIALFFTLFGTILGGIWADQSWGRFWGWDPKENGALLIVLWFLLLLHGRVSGIMRDNSFAFGLVINNIIVALAWFGVNLLNVGLHSYGFTDSIAMNLLLFCGFELLIGLVGYVWARAKTPA